MTQFYEGQEVEVTRPPYNDHESKHWRKATIAESHSIEGVHPGKDYYSVLFANGERAVFSALQIKAVD
jgi:hypothetical protein